MVNAPYDLYSVLHQDLATPLLGSAAWTASAWVASTRAPGSYASGQYIGLTIRYTDGTANSAGFYAGDIMVNALNGQNGWQLWDFKSAINPDKYVKSLDFTVAGMWNSPNDVLIDDVSLSKWVYVNP